jgi:hypothetical protein
VLALALFVISISFWELMSFFAAAVTSESLKLLAQNITNGIVIPVCVFLLLFFALAYAEKQEWVKWTIVLGITNVVVLSALLAIDPDLLYESQGLLTRGPVTIIGFTFQ